MKAGRQKGVAHRKLLHGFDVFFGSPRRIGIRVLKLATFEVSTESVSMSSHRTSRKGIPYEAAEFRE